MLDCVFAIVLASAFVDIPSVGSCQQTCRGMIAWAPHEFWVGECKKMIHAKQIHVEGGTDETVRALTADAYRLVRRYYVMKKLAEEQLLRTDSSPETARVESCVTRSEWDFMQRNPEVYHFLAHIEVAGGTKYDQLIPTGGAPHLASNGFYMYVSIPSWQSLLPDWAVRHDESNGYSGVCIVACQKGGNQQGSVGNNNITVPSIVAVFNTAAFEFASFAEHLDLLLVVGHSQDDRSIQRIILMKSQQDTAESENWITRVIQALEGEIQALERIQAITSERTSGGRSMIS